MTSDEKQLKSVRDYHIAQREEFYSFHRNSKGQSESTMKYYEEKAGFHRECAKYLQGLAERHGYKID